MKAVFGKDVESFSMFTMNKYISSCIQIQKFKPLDLTPSTRKRKAEDGARWNPNREITDLEP